MNISHSISQKKLNYLHLCTHTYVPFRVYTRLVPQYGSPTSSTIPPVDTDPDTPTLAITPSLLKSTVEYLVVGLQPTPTGHTLIGSSQFKLADLMHSLSNVTSQ
ncbi:hypothetical protein FRB91_005623 [Serendipita sp. 411]|nr:hypothetical protein FRB91_005623 [Serendipita sp. 411]